MHAFLTFPFFPFSPPSDIFYNSLYSTSNHSESAHSSTDHFFLPSHVISFYLSSISSPPIVIINQIDAEAADKLGQKYGQVENLTGAWHSKGGKLEYEVHFYGTKDKDNKYICRDDLDAMGFGPLCRQVCVSCCLYYISIFQ